jgi:hypothetical protein
MHLAVTFALHFARAVTVARRAQATFASTLQVAPQAALHLLWQEPSVCVMHWELQASLHWAPHAFSHSVGLAAPAHSARQLLAHCALQVEPQFACAFAWH